MTQSQVGYSDLNDNGLLDLDIFFDFLCPFSYQVALWINQVSELMGSDVMAVRWRYFSLEQSHRPNEEWNIWEQTPGATQGLWPFLAGNAALQVGGEAALGKFYLALGKLRHEDGLPIWERQYIDQAWQEAGLEQTALDPIFNGSDRSGYEKIKLDHTEAVERYGAFGSPTLVFEESRPFFFKLNPRPTEIDEALELFQHIQRLAMGFHDGVHEFKRTK